MFVDKIQGLALRRSTFIRPTMKEFLEQILGVMLDFCASFEELSSPGKRSYRASHKWELCPVQLSSILQFIIFFSSKLATGFSGISLVSVSLLIFTYSKACVLSLKQISSFSHVFVTILFLFNKNYVLK